MLSRVSLAALAYGVVVFASPTVSIAAGLTDKTSISNTDTDGLKKLEVTATIVNTSGETLQLFGPPGVLNPSPENSFTITDQSRSSPLFSGRTLDYSPMRAAGLGNSGALTVLAAGNFIDVAYDPPAAEDFTQPVAGGCSIESSIRFTDIGAEGTPKELYATAEGVAKIKLSGDPPVSRPVHNKRASFEGCSVGQQRKLKASAKAAQTLVVKANRYISSISAATPRYTTWFGAYDDIRKATVQSIFQNISQNTDFSALNYICNCNEKDTTADVDPNVPWEIRICHEYWDERASYRTTILIHEATHFLINGNTTDSDYGSEDCKQLASRNPTEAITNADNYMYFAKNDPALK